jgi:putative oxidoreductase
LEKPVLRVLPAPARDIALLVSRVLVGVVLIAHGWQKLVTNGLGATTAGFEKMGVPLPAVSAGYAAIVEVVGGALLIAGALTALVSALVILDMLGAAVLVHVSNGILITRETQGWELVGVIGAVALALAAAGAGRFSVDHAVSARRSAVTV